MTSSRSEIARLTMKTALGDRRVWQRSKIHSDTALRGRPRLITNPNTTEYAVFIVFTSVPFSVTLKLLMLRFWETFAHAAEWMLLWQKPHLARLLADHFFKVGMRSRCCYIQTQQKMLKQETAFFFF